MPASAADHSDLRVDPLTGDTVYIVRKRQQRPNLPESGCPFCVGGLEAPEPYDVRWFKNRWPALPDGLAEVVLYSPEHDATFWELGRDGARKVIDLWAERTAELGGRDDVDYVLIFENRGPEVGATIAHPHGQIYAFDHVPERLARELVDGRLDEGSDRLVSSVGGWSAWVPFAPSFPYALRIASNEAVGDLPSLDDRQRNDLAQLLVDVLARLDQLFDARTPYMLWIHQRPSDGGDWPLARLHIEIVSPWRTKGVMRFVAAGELGSGEFFNTVEPETAAAQLRNLIGAS
ncbi:MAG: DUF4931 domain-containing protein [Acidimicrobiales bacterium]